VLEADLLLVDGLQLFHDGLPPLGPGVCGSVMSGIEGVRKSGRALAHLRDGVFMG
jgi:hypothetical protein